MINWDQEDLKDPKNDLCTKVNGKYVDVVQSFNGTWWPMYDNEDILDRNGNDGLPTREDAMKFLENFLAEKG
jgi:hypothetical protein